MTIDGAPTGNAGQPRGRQDAGLRRAAPLMRQNSINSSASSEEENIPVTDKNQVKSALENMNPSDAALMQEIIDRHRANGGNAPLQQLATQQPQPAGIPNGSPYGQGYGGGPQDINQINQMMQLQAAQSAEAMRTNLINGNAALQGAAINAQGAAKQGEMRLQGAVANIHGDLNNLVVKNTQNIATKTTEIEKTLGANREKLFNADISRADGVNANVMARLKNLAQSFKY